MPTNFTAAWLAQDKAARPFLPLDFRRPEDRAEAVRTAARTIPNGVAEAWRAQERRRGNSVSREANLSALLGGEAVAVVTGQQAGLFTGPLYTIYKAAAAVVTARELERETGQRAVPVFWLQTEDHDWPEIDHCWVPSSGGPRRIGVADTLGPAAERVSVAHRSLGQGIVEAMDALDDALGTLPRKDEVVALLNRHYRSDATPGEALGGAMAELFAEAGLLVLNPRDPALAAAAAPVHRRAIANAGPIARALNERAAALEAAGFDVQVHVRDDAPLSFVHPDGPEGPRFRLERDGDGWEVVGADRHVGDAELSGWLSDDPGRLSTSALLRPVLQDTWLPTAAYVGGPGEIAYLAQVEPLYEAFGLPMPLIVPRARFRLVDDKCSRLLEQLELRPCDAERPRHELLAEVGEAAAGQPEPEGLLAELTGPLEGTLARLEAAADGFDKGLHKAVLKAREHVVGHLEGLVERYRRTLARHDEVTAGRVDRLRDQLAPNDSPQERVYGMPWFAALVGPGPLVDAVLAACVPWEPEPIDLEVSPS